MISIDYTINKDNLNIEKTKRQWGDYLIISVLIYDCTVCIGWVYCGIVFSYYNKAND